MLRVERVKCIGGRVKCFPAPNQRRAAGRNETLIGADPLHRPCLDLRRKRIQLLGPLFRRKIRQVVNRLEVRFHLRRCGVVAAWPEFCEVEIPPKDRRSKSSTGLLDVKGFSIYRLRCNPGLERLH